jgi:hypothetical protein
MRYSDYLKEKVAKIENESLVLSEDHSNRYKRPIFDAFGLLSSLPNLHIGWLFI